MIPYRGIAPDLYVLLFGGNEHLSLHPFHETHCMCLDNRLCRPRFLFLLHSPTSAKPRLNCARHPRRHELARPLRQSHVWVRATCVPICGLGKYPCQCLNLTGMGWVWDIRWVRLTLANRRSVGLDLYVYLPGNNYS